MFGQIYFRVLGIGCFLSMALLSSAQRRCVKMRTFFFYAQSPDFHKQGLCYYLKILYL